MQSIEPCLSVEGVAQYWGINIETIKRWWLEKKKISSVHRISRQWQFKINKMDEWVNHSRASQENFSEENTHV